MNTKVVKDLIIFSSHISGVYINNGYTILIKLLINWFVLKKSLALRLSWMTVMIWMGCDGQDMKTEIISPQNSLGNSSSSMDGGKTHRLRCPFSRKMLIFPGYFTKRFGHQVGHSVSVENISAWIPSNRYRQLNELLWVSTEDIWGFSRTPSVKKLEVVVIRQFWKKKTIRTPFFIGLSYNKMKINGLRLNSSVG